jgi:hypothetical protein
MGSKDYDYRRKNQLRQFKYKSYQEYVAAQKEANRKKANKCWAVRDNIKAIAEYVKPIGPLFGLCHGTRGGYEQKWFREFLPGCEVWGTEIGDASAEYTIQWDFNNQNEDWLCKFDFIYSNSFDHAFNPEHTLLTWSEQVRPEGFIILEYDRRNEHTGEVSKSVNPTDPNSITIDELISVIPDWLPGCHVLAVLDMPVVKVDYQKAIVIKVRHEF